MVYNIGMIEDMPDPKDGHIPAFSPGEIERQRLKAELDEEAMNIESHAGNEEVAPVPHVPPEIIQEIIQHNDSSSQ